MSLLKGRILNTSNATGCEFNILTLSVNEFDINVFQNFSIFYSIILVDLMSTKLL